MLFTTDKTAALAEARNDNLTLDGVRGGRREEAADSDRIGGVIEALAAVIPTGVTALYTAGSVTIQAWALNKGADERAHLAARIGAKTPRQVKRALEGVPLESKNLMWVRILLLVAALLTALCLAFRGASDGNKRAAKKRKAFVAEPAAAAVAFAGWALAVPGTPFAAYFSSSDVVIPRATVVVLAALYLLAVGQISLTKRARKAKHPT
jgi:hypothetical protein